MHILQWNAQHFLNVTKNKHCNSNENFAKSQNHEIEKTERYYCHKHPRDRKTFRANEKEKSREGPHRISNLTPN